VSSVISSRRAAISGDASQNPIFQVLHVKFHCRFLSLGANFVMIWSKVFFFTIVPTNHQMPSKNCESTKTFLQYLLCLCLSWNYTTTLRIAVLCSHDRKRILVNERCCSCITHVVIVVHMQCGCLKLATFTNISQWWIIIQMNTNNPTHDLLEGLWP
jgi:hypothetical protein